jgi:hypothetical protein
MTRPPWHALSVSEVRETTGATTWTLAKARMERGGWPTFEKGTFKGNRSYYVAGFVQHPDQPLWLTCRAFLSDSGLCGTTATPEEVWQAVVLYEGLSLWSHAHPPRRAILERVQPLFFDDA